MKMSAWMLSLAATGTVFAGAEPLSNVIQLTFPKDFARAGEAYFSPDAKWIIFQAIPRPPEGAEAPTTGPQAATAYAMFVAKLTYGADGLPTGIGEPIMISPEGSANTCGYFHPREPWRVIFGSTVIAPEAAAPAGYQRGTSTYAWQFPTEMEVTTRIVPQIFYDGRPKLTEDVDWSEEQLTAAPLWVRPGYDAECAYSPDARHIVYTRVDVETLDPDLYIFDTTTSVHRPLIVAKGYDGGPFFSPDGSLICYRSDRKGNDLLQVFIAELAFDDAGAILGVKREMQVTDNEHVNWAPFWHPSGEFLLYTTSEQGHRNYEVYSTQVPIGVLTGVKPADLKRRRITATEGFDGLPAFSRRGDLMMWTSQRGPRIEGEDRPSSQLWIAVPGDLTP